jgi:CheY-like chemotaxis protein
VSTDKETRPVLIVDDHADTREVAGLILSQAGYSVAYAADGREALDLLAGGLRPCLIVLDLWMPGMNGYELRDEQLKNPEFAGIPIVVCSADPLVAERARAMGTPLHHRKPIAFDQLLAVVDEACRK